MSHTHTRTTELYTYEGGKHEHKLVLRSSGDGEWTGRLVNYTETIETMPPASYLNTRVRTLLLEEKASHWQSISSLVHLQNQRRLVQSASSQ